MDHSELRDGTASDSPLGCAQALLVQGWCLYPVSPVPLYFLTESDPHTLCHPALSSGDSTLATGGDVPGHVVGFTHHYSAHTDITRSADALSLPPDSTHGPDGPGHCRHCFSDLPSMEPFLCPHSAHLWGGMDK